MRLISDSTPSPGNTVITPVMIMLMLAISGCGPRSGEVSGTADGRRKNPPSHAETMKSNPEAKVVDYQSGIRIDFRVPQVEIPAEVIHRVAELELFAYSKAPTPKEHETILLLQARPLHIHEALGLIGLTPGHPASYNWETKVITPAKGDAVDVLVRHEKNGALTTESACHWMFDVAADAPMAQTHWLFTGSRRDENGRYAADVEGTVVTVVNFDTALLSLPESHTSSDASLWLTANSAEIPEVGTKVTLILRPAQVPASSKE